MDIDLKIKNASVINMDKENIGKSLNYEPDNLVKQDTLSLGAELLKFKILDENTF